MLCAVRTPVRPHAVLLLSLRCRSDWRLLLFSGNIHDVSHYPMPVVAVNLAPFFMALLPGFLSFQLRQQDCLFREKVVECASLLLMSALSAYYDVVCVVIAGLKRRNTIMKNRERSTYPLPNHGCIYIER